jgi:WD40 repeat protein
MASLRSNQIIYDVMSKENIDRRGQFCYASWGPVGTGQAGSCAIATISTTARVVIYVAPKFVLSYAWEELVNLSEKLLLHLEEIQMIQWNSQETSTSPHKVFNKRRAAVSTPPATLASHRSSLVTSEQYSTFCDLLNVQTAAWSPKLKDGQKSGFLALGGSLLVTLWKYNFQSHGCHFEERPCSLLKTQEYGKIVSSAWTKISLHDTDHPLRVVYGSCQGWILICNVSPAGEARIDRSWRTDGAYDVLSIAPMHLKNAIVFSAGSTLGVWNLTTEKSTTDAHTWQAHDHNISGLVISCMDEVFSCALDGSLKQWDVKGKDPRCLATFE